MEGEYYGRAMDNRPLGEDEGSGVEDRGLFGRHHGHGGYGDGAVGVGPGYGARPPMPYDGGYGGSELRRLPPQDTAYEGGYSGSTAAPFNLGYGRSDGYGDRGRHGHGKKDDDDELEHERKHKHYAEAAAAAAIGYGLYERHEKNELEEKLEEVHGYDSDGNKKPDSQKYDY